MARFSIIPSNVSAEIASAPSPAITANVPLPLPIKERVVEIQYIEKPVVEYVERIVEVPVERVVTKEVIKEVPVERVITKTEIKEVPVERIVTKTELKEIPIELKVLVPFIPKGYRAMFIFSIFSNMALATMLLITLTR